MPVAAVVVNPTHLRLEQLRSVVDGAAHRAGWAESSWFETTADDPGGRAAAQALATSPDVLIVVGGDGTVRAAAAEVRRTRVPMTIVPTGTGNLLARNLRLPLNDLDRTVSAAFLGNERVVDMVSAVLSHQDGSESERIFVAMAGIGLDAAMAVNSDTRLNRCSAGWRTCRRSPARSSRTDRSRSTSGSGRGRADQRRHTR